MTRLGRAVLGAAIGAAITLILHPVSRPYLFSAITDPAPRRAPPAQKGIPSDLVELSTWMLAVGDKFLARKHLTALETANAIAAAKRGEDLDKRNAYWPQMLACLYHQADKETEAKKEWFRAAECDVWNDYQSAELLRERNRLADQFSARESWQLAYLYYQRSAKPILMITAYGRSLLSTAPLDTRDGLLIRAANIRNGNLLRDGARSIQLGDYGAQMSEISCHPADLLQVPTHHKSFLARISIHNKLRQIGEPRLAEEVNHIYREVDGWNAFLDAEDASSRATELSLFSLMLVALPSAFLMIGSVGLAVLLLGRVLQRLEHFEIVPTVAVAVLLGIGAYAITLLPLAGTSASLCCLFLILGPKRERRVRLAELGPMFSFSVGTLGFVFALLLGAFLVGASAPAVSLLPFLDVPREYFGGSGVLLGLAVIVLALLLLVAPMFAIALRVGTPYVLGLALRKFGAFLAYLSLLIVVVGTPLCIYADRTLSESLDHIVTNEPVYYLSLPR